MDSQKKYDEKKQEELECYRSKFAGQKIVCCATSANIDTENFFDFTDIKPEDINFGIHGDEYIKAKARKKSTGEISLCYLKYVTKEASIISYKDAHPLFKNDIKDFNVEEISGYKEEFKAALISHINSGLYKNEDLKAENFKIVGRNIEFCSNDRAHWFNMDNKWPKKMQGKMLWPPIVDQDVMDKVRKAYEGKSLSEVSTKMATGKFPEEKHYKKAVKNMAKTYLGGKMKGKEEGNKDFEKLFQDSHLHISYDTDKGYVILNNQKGEELERIKLDNIFENDFERHVTEYLNGLRDMLIEKNKSYGNSALDPIRVFSTADSEEQIKVRIDDKLSRIQRGNNSFNEDTIKDLIGYLVLLQYKKTQE